MRTFVLVLDAASEVKTGRGEDGIRIQVDAPYRPGLKQLDQFSHVMVFWWARFLHKGPTRELDLTLDYLFHTWLSRSGCVLSQPLVVEQFYQGVQQAEQADGERAIMVPLAQGGEETDGVF